VPIEPLTHSHFLPSPSYARGGEKGHFNLPQLSWGRGERPFSPSPSIAGGGEKV